MLNIGVYLTYCSKKINAILIHLVEMFMGDQMINKKTVLTRTIPFAIVGLIAFVAYLLFFVNVNEMISTLGRTNLLIFLLATAATVLEMVFFALTWQFFLKPLAANVPLKKIFVYSWISSFIDLMIPAESVSGEISRVIFVRKDGVNTGKAAASVIIQRVVSLFIVAGTLAIGALLMLGMQISLPSIVQSLIYLIISVTAIFLILAIFIFIKENWAHKITEKVIGFMGWITRGRFKTVELKQKAKRAIDVFYESLRIFRANPRRIIPPVALSIVSWFFAILVYYLAFAAIGYTIDWITVIVCYSIVIGIKAVPVGVPGEIGIPEIAMTVIFGAFNVPLAISAAAVVLIRIITVWFRLIIGFVAFQFVGIKTLIEVENTLFHKK